LTATDSDGRARAHADADWRLMAEHQVTPTPDNFRVWYANAAGTDAASPTIARASRRQTC